MEIIHDVEDGKYKYFHNLKKISVDEFNKCNPHKLINVLNKFNLLHFLIMSEEFKSVEDMDIDSLRENIFQLVKGKIEFDN